MDLLARSVRAVFFSTICVWLGGASAWGCSSEIDDGDAASGGTLSTGATGGVVGSGGSGSGGTDATSGGGSVSGGASSGGTGGAAASGGAAAFEPCPASEPCRILPLGDSITFGLGSEGGYRIQLFSRALADGKNITFVGSQSNGPDNVSGSPFPKNHDGYSGYTIQQIADMIPDKLAPAPHVILVHLGTNDMYSNPTGASDRLGALIDEITTELPESLVLVSSIIPFPALESTVAAYNATIPGLVEARRSAGAHVAFVDQFEDFPTDELGDGVHPDADGYARMGDVWYEALAPFLR